MAPRLRACYFRGAPGWDRLGAVLARSAARYCPTWDVAVEELPVPTFASPMGVQPQVWNTRKLAYWADQVDGADDGDRLLLVDADMLVTNVLDPLWDQPFDVAYTVRPEGFRFPLNAGVIALRVSGATRAFVSAWREANDRMFHDAALLAPWRRRYGGMNQAALGYLLEHGAAGVALAALPCRIWNCEDSSWPAFSEATRLVHIKSDLRLAVMGRARPAGPVSVLAETWRRYDRPAAVAGAPA